MVLDKIPSIILVIVLLGSCQGTKTKASDNEESVEVDAELVFMNNCASCHKLDGSGGIAGAKDLRESSLLADSIRSVIMNGRKAMPPFKYILSEEELTPLTEYVERFKKIE